MADKIPDTKDKDEKEEKEEKGGTPEWAQKILNLLGDKQETAKDKQTVPVPNEPLTVEEQEEQEEQEEEVEEKKNPNPLKKVWDFLM